MKVKVANSSSRKTRDKIKKAFAILMKEKQSLDKMTVTDLVLEADITRSAFYTHYDNIYDVAKDLQEETLEILMGHIDQLKTREDINLHFDEIFLYLKNHEEIYSLILSSDDPLLFTSSLSKIMRKNVLSLLEQQEKKMEIELTLTLFIDGCISLVVKYFRKEISYSLDEINETIKKNFALLFFS